MARTIALNIAAWPIDDLPAEMLSRVLAGTLQYGERAVVRGIGYSTKARVRRDERNAARSFGGIAPIWFGE